MNDSYEIRRAIPEDIDVLKRLIGRSARKIGTERYTAEQMETALRGAFGVDSQLITDGTYFVVEGDEGLVVACGGWSWRRKFPDGPATGSYAGGAGSAGMIDGPMTVSDDGGKPIVEER